MNSPVHITPADPASDTALACLAAYFGELNARFPDGFDPGPPNPADQAQLRAPRGVFLIARADDRALGCCGLRSEADGWGEVKRLWVDPATRGHGLARSLMVAIETHARTIGLTRLRLDTSAHLPEAVAFYDRLGWNAVARYNDNPYAHHWFAKAL